MAKKVSEKIIQSVVKISNIGDTLLQDEKHPDWEIEKIVLSSKSNPTDRVECSWVLEDGEWVKKCVRI